MAEPLPDAAFYLLGCLRTVTERMAELGVQTESAHMVNGMLEAARPPPAARP